MDKKVFGFCYLPTDIISPVDVYISNVLGLFCKHNFCTDGTTFPVTSNQGQNSTPTIMYPIQQQQQQQQ